MVEASGRRREAHLLRRESERRVRVEDLRGGREMVRETELARGHEGEQSTIDALDHRIRAADRGGSGGSLGPLGEGRHELEIGTGDHRVDIVGLLEAGDGRRRRLGPVVRCDDVLRDRNRLGFDPFDGLVHDGRVILGRSYVGEGPGEFLGRRRSRGLDHVRRGRVGADYGRTDRQDRSGGGVPGGAGEEIRGRAEKPGGFLDPCQKQSDGGRHLGAEGDLADESGFRSHGGVQGHDVRLGLSGGDHLRLRGGNRALDVGLNVRRDELDRRQARKVVIRAGGLDHPGEIVAEGLQSSCVRGGIDQLGPRELPGIRGRFRSVEAGPQACQRIGRRIRRDEGHRGRGQPLEVLDPGRALDVDASGQVVLHVYRSFDIGRVLRDPSVGSDRVVFQEPRSLDVEVGIRRSRMPDSCGGARLSGRRLLAVGGPPELRVDEMGVGVVPPCLQSAAVGEERADVSEPREGFDHLDEILVVEFAPAQHAEFARQVGMAPVEEGLEGQDVERAVRAVLDTFGFDDGPSHDTGDLLVEYPEGRRVPVSGAFAGTREDQ